MKLYEDLNVCEVRSDGAWRGGEVGHSDSWVDSVAFIARTMRIGFPFSPALLM